MFMLGRNKSLMSISIRPFARAVRRVNKLKTVSIKDKKERKMEQTFRESLVEEDNVDDFLDSALYQSTPLVHDTTGEFFERKKRPDADLELDGMCKYNIDMETLPEDLLQVVNKIFSKHSRYEVKTWGNRLMDHYIEG